MREPGLEPGSLAAQDPKSCAFASSATPALTDRDGGQGTGDKRTTQRPGRGDQTSGQRSAPFPSPISVPRVVLLSPVPRPFSPVLLDRQVHDLRRLPPDAVDEQR